MNPIFRFHVNALSHGLKHTVRHTGVDETSQHLQQEAISVSIPEPQILTIRQILKGVLFALLLVHGQGIPPSILPPQHRVQNDRNADQYCITADDTLPDARIVTTDFLRPDPERSNNIT